jgi:two-component system chemotaxis response regulator CheY
MNPAESRVLNVLIVDDDEITQFHASQLLMSIGHCRMAYTGMDAIARVEESIAAGEPYDLILMDVVMPGLDGLTTVREIVKLFNDNRIPLEKRPKIVMLSSVDERDTQIDALYACGADHYLLKPLDGNELVKALAELGLISPPL